MEGFFVSVIRLDCSLKYAFYCNFIKKAVQEQQLKKAQEDTTTKKLQNE